MAAFEYIALDAQGRERKGLIEGDTPKHVRQLLREKHLLPVEIQESTERELKQRRARRFMRRGLSTLDLALLTRQLATLLRSGLPLEDRSKPSPSRPRSRASSESSSACAARWSKPPSGRWPEGLSERLPGDLSATVSAASNRASSTRCSSGCPTTPNPAGHGPAGQQCAGLSHRVDGAVLRHRVVLAGLRRAQVVAVFESGHQELPFATRFLIALSDMVRLYWYYGVIVTGLAVWAFRRWLRAPEARLRFHRFLLRVPLLGKLIRGVNTARFARTFSILTASAVPVLEALRISRSGHNLPMKQAVEEAALRVREGAPSASRSPPARSSPP